MLIVNKCGEIVLLNLQAEKQFGYARDELLGQTVTSIIPEGFAERLLADGFRTAAEALAQQIGTGIELTARRKDGSEFPIEDYAKSAGNCRRHSGHRRDPRHQIETFGTLEDEFVSTVSHELRTPLTSISGSLALLVGHWSDRLPEVPARLISIAHKNSRRLIRLLNDILDIEKLESGHVVYNLCEVNLRRLIEQTIDDNRGLADSCGINIRFDTASADGEVNADPDRLVQVLTNLLSNAIKYSR
jgi:PAS domain S-box-containing protein